MVTPSTGRSAPASQVSTAPPSPRRLALRTGRRRERQDLQGLGPLGLPGSASAVGRHPRPRHDDRSGRGRVEDERNPVLPPAVGAPGTRGPTTSLCSRQTSPRPAGSSPPCPERDPGAAHRLHRRPRPARVPLHQDLRHRRHLRRHQLPHAHLAGSDHTSLAAGSRRRAADAVRSRASKPSVHCPSGAAVRARPTGHGSRRPAH